MRKVYSAKLIHTILVLSMILLSMTDKTVAGMVPETLGYGNLGCVAFSPDGKNLATGSKAGTVRLWDCATGKMIKTLLTNFPVRSVGFSPDGTTLFSGSSDTFPNFLLWNVKTGERKDIKSIDVIRHSLTQEQNLNMVKPGSWTIFWKTASDTVPVIRFFKGSFMVLSQDGNKVFAQAINRYDPPQLSDINLGFISSFSTRPVNCAAFFPGDPNGMEILIGTMGSACIWDVRNNSIVRTFGDSGNVRGVAVSSDGSKVITSLGSKAILWNALSGEKISSVLLPSEVATVAFSPDNTCILTTSDDNTIRLWDAASGSLKREFTGHTQSTLSVAFSPDNKNMITGAEQPDNTLRLWDIATGSITYQFHGHKNSVTSVAFSPDGSKILTGSLDSTAQLWDASSGTAIASLRGHTARITSVAFSPDGKVVATGSYDYSVCLWSVDSATLIRKLTIDSSLVSALAFSPDGSKIATGALEILPEMRRYRVRLWSVATGDSVMLLPRFFPGYITTVAFSSDGTKLLTAYEEAAKNPAAIFDISGGDAVWMPEYGQYSYELRYAAFSPDCKSVFTGSGKQNLLLWDATDQTVIKTIISNPLPVNALAFSHDGARVSAGVSDGIVRIWNIKDTSHVKRTVNTPSAPTGFRFFSAEKNSLVFHVPLQHSNLKSVQLHIYTPGGKLVGKYSGIPGRKNGTISFYTSRVPGCGTYLCRLGNSRNNSEIQICRMVLMR
ncbi:MAG: hypothetical protein JW915_00540 [Chitinispirillaceae bacterium]|nr:hypothetical protein [Chitinispirillaceae bacterium]